MRVQSLAAVLLTVMLIASVAPGCLEDGDNKPPRAVFETTVSSVDVGDVIVFDATNSTDKDGRITSYHWSFGDGDERLGRTVDHVFSHHGIYNVTLTVTDDMGKKSIYVQTIIVNALPTAVIKATPDVQFVGEMVSFSSQASYDRDGTITSFAWDFGDGNASSLANPEHAYAGPGSFLVTLTVKDNRGATAQDTQFVRVEFRTFNVTFISRGANLNNVRDYTTEGSMTYANSTIEVDNLHLVRVRLTWRDGQKPPGGEPNDLFRLTVTPPDGFGKAANSTREEITLIFPLASIPLNKTMQGPDAGSVEERAKEELGSTMGRGTWMVQVEALECGGFWKDNEYNVDLGNPWDLAVHYEYFDISVTES